MAARASGGQTGRVNDPMFVFMLTAVLLAVGSSFALRAVVAHAGPSAAHGASLESRHVEQDEVQAVGTEEDSGDE